MKITYFLLLVAELLLSQDVAQCEEYVISSITDTASACLRAVTGRADGWVQLQAQMRRNLTSYGHVCLNIHSSMRTTTGIEDKSITVSTSDDGVGVYGEYRYSVFTPIPVSALGTKYIVSSCHPPGDYTSVLVIVSHRHQTDVGITFRLQGSVTYGGRAYSDGDTLSLSLKENQTFTIRSDFDLTGTVVNTRQSVAVFIGTSFRDYISAYDQLLPVHHYGTEFVVAIDDSLAVYQLQIVSEHSDAEITFNNGSTVSVNSSCLYRQTLTRVTDLYFTSSQPVMTTLCRANGLSSGFVIVPAVTQHTRHTTIFPYGRFIIVTDDVDTIVSTMSTDSISGQWKAISGTKYKVGIWNHTFSSVAVNTSTSFILLVLVDSLIHNGGYNFPSFQGEVN